MWSNVATPTRHINCGLPPEFFLVAPASSFQQHHAEAAANTAAINFDPHQANTIGVGVGVIPLLATTPCLQAPPSIGGGADEELLSSARNRDGAGGGMQLWQQHQQGHNSPACLKKPTIADHTNLISNAIGGGDSSGIRIGGLSSSMIGAATCQDCGNQAKKDCTHRRCRTCCKSRGYDCATHVKSTWVAAARRRERQLITATAGSSQSTSGAKKPKLGGASTASHTSTSNTTPPRSFDTSSSHQEISFKDAQLPGQVRAPAVFKCVKVTALHDGEDEYAYQAVVRIGGHVFKGFLYDQGFEGREGFPNMSELYVGAGGRNGGFSSSSTHQITYPSEMYNAATSGGGLLGGSNYGNAIN